MEKITILTNPSFLLKFSTTRFSHVSAYYQVMFNTDEQFLFYNFIMKLVVKNFNKKPGLVKMVVIFSTYVTSILDHKFGEKVVASIRIVFSTYFLKGFSQSKLIYSPTGKS